MSSTSLLLFFPKSKFLLIFFCFIFPLIWCIGFCSNALILIKIQKNAPSSQAWPLWRHPHTVAFFRTAWKWMEMDSVCASYCLNCCYSSITPRILETEFTCKSNKVTHQYIISVFGDVLKFPNLLYISWVFLVVPFEMFFRSSPVYF